MSPISNGPRKVRVLVADDSVMNRQAITSRLVASGEVEVVGRAADGTEALRLVYDHKPDVITLDLEMPKMDGFSFLRLLMASRPTPVIIVSSYGQKENVFRALELGAVDFVVKPDGAANGPGEDGFGGLLQKVLLCRGGASARGVNVRPSLHPPPAHPNRREAAPDGPRLAPRALIAIAASTGGPSALGELFARLSGKGNYAVVVAQHMPERFTRTFAERLDRKSALRVSEAQDGDVIAANTAFVCPGGQCMEVEAGPGGQLRVRLSPPGPDERYAPSGNRLLSSAARAMRSRCMGIVLTGMGDDGAEGAVAIADNGGVVVAESEETAVIFGMPGAALRAGCVTRSLPIHKIAEYIDDLVR